MHIYTHMILVLVGYDDYHAFFTQEGFVEKVSGQNFRDGPGCYDVTRICVLFQVPT